ncbi:MAG: hypothetical protein IKR42_06270 [Campylobacter sp.]|nr:hypothetical protein [Campylobacter sp.]
MNSKIRKTIKPLFISLVASFFIAQVSAKETVTVSSGGKDMFDLVFLSNSECTSGSQSVCSSGDLSENQKRVVRSAAQIWADILAPGSKNEFSSVIEIAADNNGEHKDTAAFYTTWFAEVPKASAIGDAIINDKYAGIGPGDISYGVYQTWADLLADHPTFNVNRTGGSMIMGTQVESDANLINEPSMVSKRDVFSTAIHEIGHGLGVSKKIMTDFIYDRNGHDYRNDPDLINKNAGQFMDSGVVFIGDNVRKVLGNEYMNRVGGLPLNGKEGSGKTEIDAGHFELDNSLQSHQMWRNWVFFMEAELAVLKDIGYDIDLKNIYGKSIYGDNQNINYTD